MTAAGGLFISLEGVDGAGKSTHLAALVQAFREAGREVVQTREPGGTALAERLRELVLHQAMDGLTEALLVFAARRDHLRSVIEPALARGAVVVCDRFTDATFAYQGSARGVDWDVLLALERMVQQRAADAGRPGLLEPDLTLWFDLPPAVAAERLSRSRVPDRFEREPQAFFEAVREGYARRAARDPQRFVRLDTNRPREEVRQLVQQALRERGLP